MPNIDRRAFFSRLGLGVVALGPLGGLAGCLDSSKNETWPIFTDDACATPPLDEEGARALLSPLENGDRLATSTVVTIRTHEHHVSLDLACDNGLFRLEVLAKDDSPAAPRPLTRTSRFDVFVVNGGRGGKRTSRAHGLAAYALAEVLTRNEAAAGPLALHTWRKRALG